MTGKAANISGAQKNKRHLVIVLVLTSIYLAAEVIGGVITHSLALLADAGHMFTDVAGIGLALLAITYAQRAPTSERTYGYYRIEILAALSNSLILVGISFYVLYEAYQRFKDPPEVASGPMLLVAVVGLVVNVIGMRLLRDASTESLNMKGAYFVVLSDLLTSIGVIVAAVVMWATRWYYVDPLLSAGIGLFILPRTWNLLRSAVGILLEGTPAEIDLDAVRKAIGEIHGVAGVHDLHVWALTSGINALSAHVIRSNGVLHDELLNSIRKRLTSDFRIGHTTIQVERVGCESREAHL